REVVSDIQPPAAVFRGETDVPIAVALRPPVRGNALRARRSRNTRGMARGSGEIVVASARGCEQGSDQGPLAADVGIVALVAPDPESTPVVQGVRRSRQRKGHAVQILERYRELLIVV